MIENPHRRAFRSKERQLRRRRAVVGAVLVTGAFAAYNADVSAEGRDPRIVRVDEDSHVSGDVDTSMIADIPADAPARQGLDMLDSETQVRIDSLVDEVDSYVPGTYGIDTSEIRVVPYTYGEQGDKDFSHVMQGTPRFFRNKADGILMMLNRNEDIPRQLVQVMTYHEMMHIFDRELIPENGGTIGTDGLMSRRDYRYYERMKTDSRLVLVPTEPGSLVSYQLQQYEHEHSELTDDISQYGTMPLFDESSYSELYDDDALIGHPYDNSGELFASMMSVFRFYPESFMSTLDTLPDDDRRKALRFASSVFLKTAEFSDDGESFLDSFDPDLVELFATRD